jgi:hypothetical protein
MPRTLLTRTKCLLTAAFKRSRHLRSSTEPPLCNAKQAIPPPGSGWPFQPNSGASKRKFGPARRLTGIAPARGPGLRARRRQGGRGAGGPRCRTRAIIPDIRCSRGRKGSLNDAFNTGDINTLTELFDESAMWHLPGRSQWPRTTRAATRPWGTSVSSAGNRRDIPRRAGTLDCRW